MVNLATAIALTAQQSGWVVRANCSQKILQYVDKIDLLLNADTAWFCGISLLPVIMRISTVHCIVWAPVYDINKVDLPLPRLLQCILSRLAAPDIARLKTMLATERQIHLATMLQHRQDQAASTRQITDLETRIS